MKLKIVRKEKAVEDIIDQADYFSRESSINLAFKFVESVEETIKRISKMPEIGQNCFFNSEELNEIRFVKVEHFDKCLILYRYLENTILILRVLHSARDITTLLLHDLNNEE